MRDRSRETSTPFPGVVMPLRAVVCDDEAHIRSAVRFALQKAGFEVEVFENGLSALEALEQKCPDLLVTDNQMPHLSGTELAQQVRANESTSDLPIIMLTAKTFEISEDELRRITRVDAVLSKPFSPRELKSLAMFLCNHATVE